MNYLLRNRLKLYNDKKVGESDEFDINVVVNLPFDESEVTLNYNNSSPSYTLVEVPREIVKSHEQDYNMFSEDPEEKHQISAPKLGQHLHCAIFSDLNMFNESGSSGRIGFDCKFFSNFMIYKSTEGWTCHHDSMGFKLDTVCCIHLPLSALKNHPVIPHSLKKIQETFPDLKIEDIVRLVPKLSPRFGRNHSKKVDYERENLKKMSIEDKDWVLGFGSIENSILQQFETPVLCLMLFKYFR